MFSRLLLAAVLFGSVVSAQVANSTCANASQSLYSFSAVDLNGQSLNLAKFQGKVTIVVNVASFCGETVSNYQQLEALYQKYNSQGLEILAFPCDQFFNQEPGENNEILNCLKYVRPGGGFAPSFNMFSKIDVNGKTRDPIYAFLTGTCGPTNPFFGDPQYFIWWDPIRVTDITWNFEKFLVGKDGQPIRRYSSETLPITMDQDIQAALRA